MKTAVAAAFASVALLVCGCAGSSRAQDGHSTPAAPSTGTGDALVLRIRTSGGIAGLGGPGSLPDFSLYGDGRAIAGGRQLTEYHLTPQVLQRLVSAASEAGLATPRTADDPRVADAMYKVITFVTGGRPRTTKIIQAGGGGDPAEKFLERLDPATWPRSDLTADPQPYRPARLAALATSVNGAGPAWPFKPLASGARVGTQSCTVLTGADVAKAEQVAAHRTQWRDRGQTFRVTIRPLLPDEPGCTALTR
ncbi:MAG: putative secreted protein [Actinoallomurus sp.]|jgi:hypothetical protein|nr:putative secreted protein [Actinoallomurus sp.]